MAQLAIASPDPVTPAGRLYVSPLGSAPTPSSQPSNQPPPAVNSGAVGGDQSNDPYAAYLTESPTPGQKATPAGVPAGADDSFYSQFLTESPAQKTKVPSREIGSGEALARGVGHGISFGTGPAIAGAQAAANPDIEAAAKKFGIDPEAAVSFLDHVAPGLKTTYGAGREMFDAATNSGEPTKVQQAYEKKRKEESDTDTEASGQHPYIYGGGELAGSLAAPIPGVAPFKAAAAGAKLAARIAPKVGNGMIQGGIGGGLFGAGEAVGKGESLPDVATGAAKGAAIGGAAGGVLGGVLGPGAAKPATPASRAVQTAEDLGAPLPKALSYDSPSGKQLGQLARQVPLFGHQVDKRVEKTLDAAEGKVGEMVDQLTPDASRSATDFSTKNALETAIGNNKKTQNAAYSAVRSSINPDQRIPMTNTEKAVREIKQQRSRSGDQNPGRGLEEIEDLIKNGGGFNGVHMRRALTREAPTPAKPNPGYDAGAYNYIAKAMTKDLHNIVQKTSVNPRESLRLFKEAESTFGYLADENKLFQKLVDANREGGISQVLSSAKEKGGFLSLLGKIKASVKPDEFERISGTILDELGRNRAGDFTFAQFATQWNGLSDGAKNILFKPEHRQWIDNIAQLAEHVKGADKYRNTSNTSGALILWEVLRAAGELGITYSAGVLTGHELATTLGGAGAGSTFAMYMASPARAASMSRWTTAYRGLTLNQPTPARIAAFKIATRNLANNIDIPFDRIMSIVDRHIGSSSVRADDEKNNGLNQKP